MWRQEGEESVLQPDDWMEGEIRNLSFWFSVRIRVNRAMERTRQISHCGTKTLHELPRILIATNLEQLRKSRRSIRRGWRHSYFKSSHHGTASSSLT